MMFERKARQLLDEYIAAEKSGQDELADSIEDVLNAEGWYITSESGTLDVIKRANEGSASAVASAVTDTLFPKENKINSYKPTEKTSVFTTKNILIGVGTLIGVGLLIWLIVWAVKRKKGQ